MLRGSQSMCMEKLFVAKNPTVGAIEFSKKVSRFLGGRNDRLASAAVYSDLVSRCSGQAAAAAYFGRAADYITRGANDVALADISAGLAAAGGNASLIGLGTALRLKAHYAKLDASVANMVVSGAADDVSVSENKKAVRADLETLRTATPGCWLRSIAHTEFKLADGKFEDASKAFDGIVNIISSRLKENAVVDETEANVATSAASIIALQVEAGSKPSKEALDSLKSQLGGDKLSDDDIIALAEVLHSAASTHHLLDFFPESEKYSIWTSAEAQRINAALNLEHGLAAKVDAAVGAFTPVKPTEAFTGDHKDLLAILDGKDAIVPALLRAKATRRDRSDIDGVFAKLDKSIPKMSKVELVRSLSEQMMFRAMVGQAVALEETHNISDAINILSKVVDGNKYLHMWRALEARGRCYRKFGKMDEAEADFKALFALKKNANRDIPSVDSYRTKSVF